MSDWMPPSDEPITLKQTEVDPTRRSGDVRKMKVERQYIPPLDGTRDEVAAFDQRIAMAVAEILVRHYYGYTWHVVAETRQGIVYFSIPDLMGATLRWVIRLADYHDLTDRLVMRAGGDLLERMGLRRGPMDLAEYEKAKTHRHLFDFGDVKQ